jgi:hypothetical protein
VEVLSSVFGKRLLPFVPSALVASGQKAVNFFYQDFYSGVVPFAFLSR